MDSFLKEKGYSYTWLSMGKNEVDVYWVWQRMIQQQKIKNTPFYEALKDIPFPETRQERERCFKILENLIQEPFVMVFDDYQECNNVRMNQFITELVYQEIPDLYIILISRIYPDLPYEEMEIKGLCLIVNQRQMTFSRDEIREFFSINGISQIDEQLDEIESYTDGWIAAVALVLLNYKKYGKFRLSIGILRLMKYAIFDKLPDNIKEVLLKMSLFDSFTMEQACYTAECEIPQLIFQEEMEKTGFIQYDYKLHTYQMHSLLKWLALSELEKSGIEKKHLYVRYAQWEEEQGGFVEAVLYYEKAGEYECILNILEREERLEILESAPVIFERIFKKIDKEICLRHPMAYLSYIYHLLMKGNIKKGISLFEEVKKKYEEIPLKKNEYLKGEICIVETLVKFNDLKIINQCLKEASNLLQHRPSSIFNTLVITDGVPTMLSLFYKEEGKLKETVEQEKEYAFYYMRLINRIEGGWDSIFDAEYYYYLGDIERAGAYSQIAYEKAKFHKKVCMIISSSYLLMRCDIYNGNKTGFYQKMKELKEELKEVSRNILLQEYELAVSYLYGLIGQADKMALWLKDFRLEECNYIIRCNRVGCVCYGLFLISEKKWILLEALSEQMLIPYGNSVHQLSNLYAYIYKAIAYYFQKEEEKAEETLITALLMAQKDRIKTPFIEDAPYLYPILDRVKEKCPYAKEILPLCLIYQNRLHCFKEKQDTVLTQREKELMALVKEGLSNREISQKLHIALVTVEKTLTAIYRKLDVTNRTAAAARIEEMIREGRFF